MLNYFNFVIINALSIQFLNTYINKRRCAFICSGIYTCESIRSPARISWHQASVNWLTAFVVKAPKRVQFIIYLGEANKSNGVKKALDAGLRFHTRRSRSQCAPTASMRFKSYILDFNPRGCLHIRDASIFSPGRLTILMRFRTHNQSDSQSFQPGYMYSK